MKKKKEKKYLNIDTKINGIVMMKIRYRKRFCLWLER